MNAIHDDCIRALDRLLFELEALEVNALLNLPKSLHAAIAEAQEALLSHGAYLRYKEACDQGIEVPDNGD